MTLCDHGFPDGLCQSDGCAHCRHWSIEKLIAAFDLQGVQRGARVTIPYGQTHAALIELKRLRELINSPHIAEFLDAVKIEAVHQRERWGVEHDSGKSDADWFWLIGYLAGKALHLAHAPPDAVNTSVQPPQPIVTKQLHHIITTAAACLNWHANKIGVSTVMRPGIAPIEPAQDGAFVRDSKGRDRHVAIDKGTVYLDGMAIAGDEASK